MEVELKKEIENVHRILEMTPLEREAVKHYAIDLDLRRIADSLERIAHSLENLDEAGIRTFPNN